MLTSVLWTASWAEWEQEEVGDLLRGLRWQGKGVWREGDRESLKMGKNEIKFGRNAFHQQVA